MTPERFYDIGRALAALVDQAGGLATRMRAQKDVYKSALLDYDGHKPSRFTRTRTGLGGSADAHFRTELQVHRFREIARDMDRNDVYVGQLVNRAVDNIVGTGIKVDPQTGDEGLDRAIEELWEDWTSDPNRCDISGRLDFHQMERLLLRHVLVDGDVFVILTDTGSLQLVEADRVTSPHNMTDSIVHGVSLDSYGRPLSYHFLEEKPGDRKRIGILPARARETREIPAVDDEGRAQVLHLFDPERITQTRGVTAFHAVCQVLGMIDDVNFAKLVQQNVVSCIAAFITSASNVPLGSQEDDQRENRTEKLESITPGMIPRLKPGEDIRGFTPGVPNPEYFEHMRELLRSVGLAFGMPLELVTLDATRSTFHGFRAAIDQARKGFRVRQRWYPTRFHRCVYAWKLREWFPLMADDPMLYRCKWTPPEEPYFDPLKDAEADKLAIRSGLDSPRNRLSRRGRDIEDVVRETIEDRVMAIRKANEAAQELAGEGLDVDWREVLGWESEGATAPPAPEPDDEPQGSEDEDDDEDEDDGEADLAANGSRIAQLMRTPWSTA